MNSYIPRLRSLFRFPFLPIWLSAMILLAPVYLAGKALFWGTPLLQFGPWWSFASKTLLSGHLPLWNPLVGMGAPLLANYQSGLLYPPNWIYLLLVALGGDRLMAWGMAIAAASHLAWAGLGMALLVRRLGLNPLAQVVSGLAFGLSGYLVARLSFFSINAAVAWLPWILLFLTPLPDGSQPGRRSSHYLAICLGMALLAGHAQTTWYTLLLALLWAGFWSWQGTPVRLGIAGRFISAVRGLKWFFLSLVLACSLAAIQLLPTAEYLAQSARASAVEYDFALNYSFWPWRLLTLFAPTLFGSPVTGDYWGYGYYWEDAVYVGLLPLLLALSGWFASIKRRSSDPRAASLAWFLAAISLIAFIFALGKNTPLYPWLYRHVPTFDMFQAPTRWMIWVEFALAVLAGMGADRWRRPQGWGLYWTRLAAMGALAVSMGAGLTWLYLGAVSPSFIRGTAIMGFIGLGAGILALTAAPAPVSSMDVAGTNRARLGKKQQGRHSKWLQLAPPEPEIPAQDRPYHENRWRWAVAAFVSLDLLIAGWGQNPGASLDLYGPSPVSVEVDQALGQGRIYLSKPQEEWLKYTRFMRFETFDPGEDWLNLRRVMLPNTPMLDEIATTNNFDPLVPGRYAGWLQMLQDASPQRRDDLLRLMGVRLIGQRDRGSESGLRFRKLDGSLYRWVSCEKLAENPDQARSWVLQADLDFDQVVVLEGLEALPADSCQSGAAQDVEILTPPGDAIHSYGASPNRRTFTVTASSPGWLVISDTWYPGWRAWVDGNPVPLLRANYLFRALRLPVGAHQVTLAYQPFPFYLGAGLTLLGMLLLVLLWNRERSSG